MASITGLVEAHVALHRLDRDQAAEQIHGVLQRIPADRRTEVLTAAAAMYVDAERWYAGHAIALLVDLGADADRARALHTEQAARWRLRIGDAEL